LTIIDLYTEQGSDLYQTITLNEDITGYSIASKVADSTGVVYQNIASVTNTSTGAILIDIPDTTTEDMATGIAHYQIELTDLEGKVSKPIKGRVYIDKEVS
jgi:hypothetical protein